MTKFDSAIEAIRDLLGPKGWLAATQDCDIAPYLSEERGLYRGSCAGVALPASTDEVAAVVRICADASIPITPQGGNTGLVGGGVPDGGIVIALKKLNRILDIDVLNQTIKVEAGTVLADIHNAAEEAGLMFPLSLGAEGSCQIGGNLSTNAGGVNVLRYGNARDLVLGIEAVLPDGQVFDGMRTLTKDNTGYDLKHLFIGAEGTLGIITAAALKLFPIPRFRETALCATASPAKLFELFKLVRDTTGNDLAAFEMITGECLELVVEHIPDTNNPFAEKHPCHGLIELGGSDAGTRENLENILAGAIDDNIITDAVIAASDSQRENLWRLRETIPEAQKKEGASIKHDIAVMPSQIPEFIDRATQIVKNKLPGVRPIAFGHMGDGNIHFNLSQPKGMDGHKFLEMWTSFNRLVHELIAEMGGSFSAEHGIGKLKTNEMKRYKSAVELELMRNLKKTLDPQNIMNPGKVIEP